MPVHRAITRLLIVDADYPPECAPLFAKVRAELATLYDENERLLRLLRAAVLETEVATSVSIDAKTRYETLAALLEGDYKALAAQLHADADLFAQEVDLRLAGMNNIRKELDLAGAPIGGTEAERIARLRKTINALQRQVDFDKHLIALYEERMGGSVDRDPTPPPALRPGDDAGVSDAQ